MTFSVGSTRQGALCADAKPSIELSSSADDETVLAFSVDGSGTQKSRLRTPKTLESGKSQFEFILNELDSMVPKREMIKLETQLELSRSEVNRLNQIIMSSTTCTCVKSQCSADPFSSIDLPDFSKDFLNTELHSSPKEFTRSTVIPSIADRHDSLADPLDRLEHYNPHSPETVLSAASCSGPDVYEFACPCMDLRRRSSSSQPIRTLSAPASPDTSTKRDPRDLRRRLNSMVHAKQAELMAAAAAVATKPGASAPPCSPTLLAELDELARFGRLLDAAARTDLRSIETEVDGLERVLCSLVQADDSAPPSPGASVLR